MTPGEKMVWAAAFIQGLVETAKEIDEGSLSSTDLNQALADGATVHACSAVARFRQAGCTCEDENCEINQMVRSMRESEIV